MMYTNLTSPLGEVTVTAENGALTGFWFVGQKYYPEITDLWIKKPENKVFTELDKWLTRYFDGENTPFPLRVEPKGTAFQKAVWHELSLIPYGSVTTYGKIALKSGGSKGYSQAVGTAVGHNPISVIIPCHRVVGTGGELTGYAGGFERKKALLKLEGADIESIL